MPPDTVVAKSRIASPDSLVSKAPKTDRSQSIGHVKAIPVHTTHTNYGTPEHPMNGATRLQATTAEYGLAMIRADPDPASKIPRKHFVTKGSASTMLVFFHDACHYLR